MKYKVGDIVRTTKDRDGDEIKVFPVGTIGKIIEIMEKDCCPYVVEAGNDYWNYSEDMLEPFKTYDQGLNDAWELAKKVVRSPKLVENAQIFIGKNIVGIERESLLIQFFELTPQEALAKLKAYEDSKIKVGDVVRCKDIKEFHLLVTYIHHGNNRFDGVKDSGTTYTERNMEDFEKTGKHIEIESILEQIREE